METEKHDFAPCFGTLFGWSSFFFSPFFFFYFYLTRGFLPLQGPAGPRVEVEYEDDDEERVPNAAAVAW
jgi:hypothetical protein